MKEIFWLKCKWSCRSHIPSKTFQLISRLNQRLIAGWCWETFPIRQIPASFTSPHSILDNLSSSSALEKGIDPIWRKSCTKCLRVAPGAGTTVVRMNCYMLLSLPSPLPVLSWSTVRQRLLEMDVLFLEEYIRDYPLSGDIKTVSRNKRSDCPGGIGNFGFNTYNLMTFMLMSFNHISNVIGRPSL